MRPMTENKAKKMPILSLCAEYPNIPAWQNSFPSRVLYTRGPRRKATGLWKEGEGSKRKEEEKEEVSCLNHRCLPLLTSHKLEGCVLDIPRGKTKNKHNKKTPLYFFFPAPLCSASQSRPCQEGNICHEFPRGLMHSPGHPRLEPRTTRTGNRRAPKHLL